ncbi:MAG TPA: hypothetical protein VEK10_02310 [Steroidobacteraceae bacterium]|nr:hypothetical protein [Steroidobacteraceae bacterium]
MKKAVLVLVATASLAGGSAVADTKDLEKVHSQIEEVMTALSKAQAAHQDELGGHAQKAGEYLNQAAKEVRAAIEYANASGNKAPANKASPKP